MNNSIPLSEFVMDTMGLVPRIERRRLGSRVKSILDLVEFGGLSKIVGKGWANKGRIKPFKNTAIVLAQLEIIPVMVRRQQYQLQTL